MGTEHMPGATGTVSVVITAADATAQTVGVRMVDNNGTPLTPAATVPMGVCTVTGRLFSVGDVVEHLKTGHTCVVRWVDPADPLKWSAMVSGADPRTSAGWKKVGTVTL